MEPYIKELKPYEKDLDYTYITGILNINNVYKVNPDAVMCILVVDSCDIKKLLYVQSMKCKGISAIVITQQRAAALNIDGDIAAVIRKKDMVQIRDDTRHLILDNINQESNMGGIIRTAVASGITDIAYIGNKIKDFDSVKINNYSVGLRHSVNIEVFDNISSYLERFPGRRIYSFILSEDSIMIDEIKSLPPIYSMAFGNELLGLGEEYKAKGVNVKIPLCNNVDSFNVNTSIGIGLYAFNKLSKLWYTNKRKT